MPLHASLKALLDNVLDAVVVVDRSGVVRGWNRIAEEVFGWSRDEAIGQSLGELIVPPEHREGHRSGMERFSRTGEAHVLDTRLKLTALTRDRGKIPVELTITLVDTPTGGAFVGFLRDLTDAERAEAKTRQLALESRLMYELSALAAESPTLEEAFEAALDAICELTEWPLGHCYIVSDDGQALSSYAWSKRASDIAPEFYAKTENTTFLIGQGFPGLILQSSQPLWVERTSEFKDFTRKGLGIESAFGFPVISRRRCVAIFEFFSMERRGPDEHVLKLVQSLGAQVGRVFEQRRTEERRQVLMSEMAHRTKNLLSVIQGIAYQTFGKSQSLSREEALGLFSERLAALAQAQTVLFGGDLGEITLTELIERSIMGCGVDPKRVGYGGPDLHLPPASSVMLSLAIHELCTNSFKYGALSVPEGNVAITWELCGDLPNRFRMRWEELGGPPVSAPTSKGFGHTILNRAIESESGGRAKLTFAKAGLIFELEEATHI